MNGNKPCGEDRESRWAPTRPGGAAFGFGSTSKIRDVHVNRLAMVYVRQSTPQQVLENRESRERQYALAEFAQRLGWPAERVMVIDEDQGQSGKTATRVAAAVAPVRLQHGRLGLGVVRGSPVAAGANGVGLCFIRGASLPDPNRILLGSGNQTRFIRIELADVLARPEVEALIAAAAALAKTPMRASGRGKLIIRSVSAKQRPRRRSVNN